jgi:6-phosphogluconolactonase
MHKGGKFLYVSNRDDNSIGVFTLDATTGKPQAGSWQRMTTEEVRHFSIDASGAYLLAANQKTAVIAVFKIDATTGALSPVGTPLAVPKMPTFVGGAP